MHTPNGDVACMGGCWLCSTLIPLQKVQSSIDAGKHEDACSKLTGNLKTSDMNAGTIYEQGTISPPSVGSKHCIRHSVAALTFVAEKIETALPTRLTPWRPKLRFL